MADVVAVRTALERCAVPMRLGPRGDVPGVVLRALANPFFQLAIARRGRVGAAIAQAAGLGIALPTTPRAVGTDSVQVLWAGPEQWLVTAEDHYDGAAEKFVARLATECMLLDQSDGRAMVEVAGPRARACLAKGLAIDLHPRSFRAGDVALTLASEISAHVWQVDDRPTYRIIISRSFAESFWHWLTESAGEYGCEVVA